MAEECKYYYFDGSDYCCAYLKAKSERYVLNSEWVHKYCWGYNSDSCPHMITSNGGSSSSSGCYLTTACVRAKKLPDDCIELCTLRNFRDSYMASFPEGKKNIAHYYAVAPHIVSEIERSPNQQSEWEKIYIIIKECIALINNSAFDAAYRLYRSMTLNLEEKYLNKAEEN